MTLKEALAIADTLEKTKIEIESACVILASNYRTVLIESIEHKQEAEMWMKAHNSLSDASGFRWDAYQQKWVKP